MRSKQLRKAAFDMSWIQMSWAVWFLAITLIIYGVIIIVGGQVEINVQIGELVERIVTGNWEDEPADTTVRQMGYFSYVSHPSKIFMLVLGILSVSAFMTFFVKHGVTRKTYFYSVIISAVFLSCMLALISGGIYIVEAWMFAVAQISPAVWITAVLFQSILLFTYFVHGWLISAGFYRSFWEGMLAIAMSIGLMVLIEGLMYRSLIERLQLPGAAGMIVSIGGSALLLLAGLWIIRQMTKNVRLRVK